MYQYFKTIGNTERITSWNSKRSSDEIIRPSTTSDNSLALSLNYIGNKTRLKFIGSCLKQDKIPFTHGQTINTYILYEISVPTCRYDGYSTLESCLFGGVKLIKNATISK